MRALPAEVKAGICAVGDRRIRHRGGKITGRRGTDAATGPRQSAEYSFKVTTDSNHDLPIRTNLLDRLFSVAEHSRVRAGDIAYIHIEAGWLFLVVMVDLLSCQVVGRPLSEDMMRDIDALCIARFKRHPC